MISLHATRKMFARLSLNEQGQFAVTPRSQWLLERPPIDVNPLSGWHGNLVTLQRRNTLFLVHDATRFPLVLPALTKPDFIEMNARFADSLMNTLLKCGATEEELSAADRHLRPLQVDTQCSRSEQATLNRMKDEIEHLLWYDQVNIVELNGYRTGAWLADTPRTVKGKDVFWPKREMLDLLTRLSERKLK